MNLSLLLLALLILRRKAVGSKMVGSKMLRYLPPCLDQIKPVHTDTIYSNCSAMMN
jgi:hypothetical protein